MRIGSILLLDGQRCVQSYGWKHKRPLGSLQLAMDSLEEFECDEVAIVRPVRDWDSFDLFRRDLEVIRSLRTMTPVSFGGGIRSCKHLDLLKNLPIERLIFSSSFISGNRNLISKAKDIFGPQAIQCLLPVKIVNEVTFLYDSSGADFVPLSSLDLRDIDVLANEVILYDVENDGCRDNFNRCLINGIPFMKSKLIITGGIGKSTVDWARREGLASVLIDNKVLHQEYSIKGYKDAKRVSKMSI